MYWNIKSVTISQSISEVNEKLNTGNWVILEICSGDSKVSFVLGEKVNSQR